MITKFTRICSIPLILVASSVMLMLNTACNLTSPSAPAMYSNPDDYNTTSIEIGILQSYIIGNDISTFASVVDQEGIPISNLNYGNFVIAEKSASHPEYVQIDYDDITMTTVGESGSDISVAFCMDYSGSMPSTSITDMENSVIAFIDLMQSADRGEIIKFAASVEVIQLFTSNKNDLISAVSAQYTGSTSFTAVLDAIYSGVVDASGEGTDVQVIIPLTDGEDNASIHTYDEVVNVANSNGIALYTIGLGASVSEWFLESLAQDTGGRYFYAPTSSEMEYIYELISSQISETYILSWKSALGGSKEDLEIRIITNYEGGNGMFSDTCYAEVITR